MGKAGKKSKDSPLRKSFDKHSKKKQTSSAPSSAAAVSREDTSGFLSYLSSAMKVQDKNQAQQALQLHEHYRELDPQQKKQIVHQFF